MTDFNEQQMTNTLMSRYTRLCVLESNCLMKYKRHFERAEWNAWKSESENED